MKTDKEIRNTLYIFLDIDGVLIPSIVDTFMTQLSKISNGELSGYDENKMMFLYPECVANFLHFIEIVSSYKWEIKIILSSEWRRDFKFDFIAPHFFHTYKINLFDALRLAEGHETKEDLILEYVERHGLTHFIAIDDMLLPNLSPSNYINCNSSYGISKTIKEKLIETFKTLEKS